MSVTKSRVIIAGMVCVGLTGCKTMEAAFDNNCKVGGTVIGAVIGGVAGGLLFGKAGGKAGTALLGMAVGGLIGQQVGSLLDCQDQQAVATASQTAGDAPVGQKVVWASDTATIPATTATPPGEQTAPVSSIPPKASAPPPPKPKAPSQAQVKAAPPSNPPSPSPSPSQPANGQWAAVEPTTKPSSGQWAAVEPVRSGGQSGMWGWVEPVTPPQTLADGRTCRTLRQVVVDKSRRQTEENVTSCLDDQKRWIIASR